MARPMAAPGAPPATAGTPARRSPTSPSARPHIDPSRRSPPSPQSSGQGMRGPRSAVVTQVVAAGAPSRRPPAAPSARTPAAGSPPHRPPTSRPARLYIDPSTRSPQNPQSSGQATRGPRSLVVTQVMAAEAPRRSPATTSSRRPPATTPPRQVSDQAMADKPSYPANDAEWKYDLALSAVTGESFDLHGPANPSDGWFKFDSEVNTEKDDFSWTIRGSDFGFSVNINRDALDKWDGAVKAVNSVMGEVEGGNHGQMSTQTLLDFFNVVDDLKNWLSRRSDEFHRYAVDLSSKDSGFKGTAAYLISDRLRQYGDGLGDLHTQLTSKNGVGVPAAVANAYFALGQYGRDMAGAWFPVQDYLYNFATSHVNWWMQVISDYMAQPTPTWTEITYN